MIYAIMCGGDYPEFEVPKPLIKVNGETLVERTIRLLKENGERTIVILSNNCMFDGFSVPRVCDPRNDYVHGTDKLWLTAFYDGFSENSEVCFVFGDVYFTEDCIKKIVNCDKQGNVLFGTAIAANTLGKNWGEPLAFVVRDYKTFLAGIRITVSLYKQGLTERHPITWELYRVLNGLDVNVQRVRQETFVSINDETIDIDTPEDAKELEEKFG